MKNRFLVLGLLMVASGTGAALAQEGVFEEILDTGLLEDTGPLDSGVLDSGDSGFLDSGDTGEIGRASCRERV